MVRFAGSARKIQTVPLVLLLALAAGCGGGEGSTAADGTPPRFAGVTGASAQASAITLDWSFANDNVTAPASIVYLVYRAAASGGQNYAAPTFTTARGALSYTDSGLAAGSTYYYVVRAMDEAGNIDSNVVEVVASTDTTPPVFGGATGGAAAGSTSIMVNWAAATDNITPQSGITYLIYRATTSGGQTYAAPTATAAAGATSYTDTGLTSGVTYFYVVRARDQAGNIDTNAVQVSAATILDAAAPTFAGASGAATQSSGSIAIGWTAATDNVTPSSGLVYLIYRATVSGGQVYATPTAITAAGATSFTDTGLAAGTTYYYVVRAQDQAGNIDANTAQASATTNSLSGDATPPTFAGASSLTVLSGTSMTLGWRAATDNVTSAANMVYVIYRATTSGGQNFAAPLAITAAGALSYVDSTATAAATKYYYVVRAKDAAGNMDSNTAEVFGPVSFANDVYTPLMAAGTATACAASGCHASATVANGGLDLSTVANAYANLVGVAAAKCTGGEKYVVAGSSSTSYVINKLTGTAMCGGSQMPKGGPFLSASQLNTVKAWIDQGAANN
ncbi:MAG: fibronectin type III domain-containing protein [Betaproteobacteria bacterium]|nr:fibronectin type III domain-containing protein [Betaproteobacteria bacterium]